MASSGVLPNPTAVSNHQDDRMPYLSCASSPIGWKEQPFNLICTPLPSDSVSTPRGQERPTWFSGDSSTPDPPPLAGVHSLESSHLNHEKTHFLPHRLHHDIPPFHEPNQVDQLCSLKPLVGRGRWPLTMSLVLLEVFSC
ncbi:hypothetical protein AMECASPLE_026457 [Ameca splendens]|uniref:Uncharacterized protein n=1 Tax=Ameca splendens TaxID=208324 RepID=A0ABV0YGJ2_9TELE